MVVHLRSVTWWLALALLVLVLFNAKKCSAQLQLIPGGSFFMGSESGDNDERPKRQVSVSGFSINSHEITEADYNSCVALGNCTPAHYDDSTCRVWNGSVFMRVRVPAAARNPLFPVVCVTWKQARQYCRSNRMDLPSEVQWEYAARAGTTQRTPWGNSTPGPQQCVTGRSNGPKQVGSCAANSWGLHDMLGNTWEWVDDWYDAEAYRYDAVQYPRGPEAGIYRVIRGSGWYSRGTDVSVSNRQWFSPDYSEVSIGFRCVGR